MYADEKGADMARCFRPSKQITGRELIEGLGWDLAESCFVLVAGPELLGTGTVDFISRARSHEIMNASLGVQPSCLD